MALEIFENNLGKQHPVALDQKSQIELYKTHLETESGKRQEGINVDRKMMVGLLAITKDHYERGENIFAINSADIMHSINNSQNNQYDDLQYKADLIAAKSYLFSKKHKLAEIKFLTLLKEYPLDETNVLEDLLNHIIFLYSDTQQDKKREVYQAKLLKLKSQ